MQKKKIVYPKKFFYDIGDYPVKINLTPRPPAKEK
jgi:hypothetical protein